MPLLDHFHPPISQRRTWEGFHGLWAATLVEYLNRDVLGEEYYADMQVHIGSQMEIDVATLRDTSASSPANIATATRVWTPPQASLVIPTIFPDEIEIQVYSTVTGANLVAAIELISPGNKDRADARRAFAAKCIGYLTRGIGLVIVDVVTNRLANLHNEIMALLDQPHQCMPSPASIYAVAYRPSRQASGDQVEIWPHVLALGNSLPTLPLALRNSGVVPIDLEGTYSDARVRSRLE